MNHEEEKLGKDNNILQLEVLEQNNQETLTLEQIQQISAIEELSAENRSKVMTRSSIKTQPMKPSHTSKSSKMVSAYTHD